MLTGILLGQALSGSGHRERNSQYNESNPANQNSANSNAMGPAGVAQRPESKGMGFFGYLITFLILGAIAFAAYTVYNARSAKKAQQQLNKGRYTL